MAAFDERIPELFADLWPGQHQAPSIVCVQFPQFAFLLLFLGRRM